MHISALGTALSMKANSRWAEGVEKKYFSGLQFLESSTQNNQNHHLRSAKLKGTQWIIESSPCQGDAVGNRTPNCYIQHWCDLSVMGLEGKFHPMGSGRRDIRRRGCTVYKCEACVKSLGDAGMWRSSSWEEEAGVGVCVSDRVLLCVSTNLIGSGVCWLARTDRFRVCASS